MRDLQCPKKWLFLVMTLVIVASVACASEDAPAPAPTQPAAAVQPTAPAAAQPTAMPAPTQPAMAEMAAEPEGTLTVALERIGLPQFVPGVITWPNDDKRWGLGSVETLFVFDKGPSLSELQPRLAESWEVTDEALVIKIRRGIPFHEDWGELTAEDVAFSVNGNIADDSVYADRAVARAAWEDWEAIDSHTVKTEWRSPNFIWYKNLTPAAPVAIGQFSKKFITETGADNVDRDIGTGPFRMLRFEAEDEAEYEAVQDHWRKTPEFAKMRVIEVREPATRVAMIKTGEADITEVPFTSFEDVQASGVKLHEMGAAGSFQGIALGGQNYITEDPWSGEPLTDSSWADNHTDSQWCAEHPWVVCDFDDAADVERAKKVRQAIATAIDKQGLVDRVCLGHCKTLFSWRFTRDSEFPAGTYEKWEEAMPPEGDPDRAKALLAEAGLSDGFKATFVVPSGARPLSEENGMAMVPMLEAVGISLDVQRLDFSAIRARYPDRRNDTLQMAAGSREPWPLLWQFTPQSTRGNLWLPESEEMVAETMRVLDPIIVWENSTKWADWIFENQWNVAVVEVERWFVSGSRVGSHWPLIPGPSGMSNSYEHVTHGQ